MNLRRTRPAPKVRRNAPTMPCVEPGGMVVYLDGKRPPRVPPVKLEAKTQHRKPPPGRRWIQHELPLMPGKHTETITVPEETVERQTIDALTAAGYMVKKNIVRFPRQQCPKCSHVFWFNPLRKFNRDGSLRGYGASKGITDLLVRNPKWPVEAVWIALEVKGSETPLSDEQQTLYDAAHIVVFRDCEDALDYLRSVDRLLFSLTA